MNHRVFFAFSSGFSKPQRVPKGTLKRILATIDHTEQTLGLVRTPTFTPEGEKQWPGWSWRNPDRDMLATAGERVGADVPNWLQINRERVALLERMSAAVIAHNGFVRGLYADMAKWQGATWKRGKAETITKAQSVEFWGGLRILELPRELWTREHYTDHMEHLHALLSTGESRGMSMGCKFSAKQIAALIWLLDGELDQWGFQADFAVPLDETLKPYNFIASSYDGGYDWCAKCGPIYSEDFHARCAKCPNAKKGACDLKNQHPGEFED